MSWDGRDRRSSCGIPDCGIGHVSGQVELIKDLLSDHIDQSRERDEKQTEQINELKTEITKYKFLFKAVIGTVIAVATFEWGDVASFWR